MISISFVAGPDPRPKVYVLVSTPENAGIISSFLEAEGFVAITTFDEMTEIELLSNLGVFSAVVVGDFIIPTQSLVKKYVYPAFDQIPRILILNSYALSDFSDELNLRYEDKISNVINLEDLRPLFPMIKSRANALGLEVGLGTFAGVSALVGLGSLIMVFLGLSFLAAKLIETGKKPGISGFAEAIVYTFLYFAFTQAIYIACSVLLAMPLGLHTGSSKVTAIGFIGLGGGSRPRMLAGLAGFLYGAIVSLKRGPKLDKTGIVAILIIGFIILVDPLTSGLIFYEFILLFMTDLGPVFEVSLAGWSYIRAFLYNIGGAFGGWVSQNYGISSGIMLYFTGAIPFCLFPRMKKSTGTVLLFFSAFCVAQGGIRIADMIALKTVASSIPGIVSGSLFAGLFGFMSVVENVIRTKISRKGSV
jgi:hypothetical protein